MAPFELYVWIFNYLSRFENDFNRESQRKVFRILYEISGSAITAHLEHKGLIINRLFVESATLREIIQK